LILGKNNKKGEEGKRVKRTPASAYSSPVPLFPLSVFLTLLYS